MPLSAGTRLGPYEIVAPLGVGGMGEVFRARDTRLDRDVAIKILPEAFAADAERVARFQREARVLASLNHPHIASIYGLEEADGITALVMELVEGEDLSQRLTRGAIPLDEVLAIAQQIAEALEAAHDQGIIHRDLKPANIKVRADGTVKVLDFGLAKAMESGGNAPNISQSPTITTPAMMTGVGVILGTAAYMSPEQARGKAVDKRTDIWAFGCLLYELLTGLRPFGGNNMTDTIAAVVRAEPDWSMLRADTPPPIRRLLRRCVEKDRKRRLADAADARLEIDDALNPPAGDLTPEYAAHQASGPGGADWQRALPWAVAGVLAVVALLVWAPWHSAPVSAPRKLLASIGVEASLLTDLGASAILSPNGSTLAFAARQAGQQTRLFIRKLDQLQATALAGTEDASNPFFSPDGQSIAFFASGQLKRVSVTGGAASTLCNAPQGRGGTWIDDGTIVFTPTGMPHAGLLRVPATGGTPAVFGTPSDGPISQLWPQALPKGKGVLYTARSAAAGFYAANLVVAPMAGGAPKIVMRGGYSGRYVPSGHLVYMLQPRCSRCASISIARDRRRGSAGARRRPREPEHRRCAVGVFLGGHAGVRTWHSCDEREPNRLDDARWHHVGASRDESRLDESAVLAGRPEAGGGHFRWQAARHLGVRVGA
jgi:serine/threonine-protein kinase